MKQKLLLLKLAVILAGMFLKDFYKESRKEIADKNLYPQGNYENCLTRASDILFNASKRAINFYALAIADHRMCTHGDNVVAEVKELSEELTEKESKQATRGFWLL